MSVYFGDKNRLIKAVAAGFIVSVGSTAILLCLFAFILNMISGIPYGIIDYAVIAVEAIAVFAGAYTAAAIMKSRGLIIGLLSALLIILLNIAFSLGSGAADIGLITAIKTVVLLIAGIVGGIVGVNKKEKIRIH